MDEDAKKFHYELLYNRLIDWWTDWKPVLQPDDEGGYWCLEIVDIHPRRKGKVFVRIFVGDYGYFITGNVGAYISFDEYANIPFFIDEQYSWIYGDD